jgi:hypothetical protein
LHFSVIASIRLLANATITLFEEISARDSPVIAHVDHDEIFDRDAERHGRIRHEFHFFNAKKFIARNCSNPIIARVSRGHYFKTPCG